VSGFPWGTLIIVAGPVTASLGAVVAKGHYDLRRDRQRADRKDLVGQAARRQDAFTDLLLTARVALRNYRTIRIAYVTNLFSDPALKAALERTDAVTEDLQRAVAVVEYVAPDVRIAAKRVNDAAASVVYIYSERSLELRLATALTSPGPAGSFDIGAAQSAIAEFTTAIDAFLDAAHLPRPDARTSRSPVRRIARSLKAILPATAAARDGGDGGA
jgi:hypothetical protein